MIIRRAKCTADLEAYYALYRKIISERNDPGKLTYERKLFEYFYRLERDTFVLLAELDGKIIGGHWCVRDGSLLYLWHSVMDYDFKRYFPNYAIINAAIRIGCQENMSAVNFGSGGGKASLEQAKSFWGTERLPYWTYIWRSPMWSSISALNKRIGWGQQIEA